MIMPRYTGPQTDPHVAWTKVKTSAMRRPYLDCGCRNSPGMDTYLHLGCPRIACKQHAEDPHECQPPEPEPEPVADEITETLRGTAYPRGDEPVQMAVDVSRDGTTAVAAHDPTSGAYRLFDEPGRLSDAAWSALINRYAHRWIVNDDLLQPPVRPDYHNPPGLPFRVAVDESIPPDEVQFRDPTTGAIVARITGLADQEPDAPLRRPWWRFW